MVYISIIGYNIHMITVFYKYGYLNNPFSILL